MSVPLTAPNELYILCALLAFVLSFIPLYWHLRAANVGTCLFMTWVGLANLNLAVNAIIWNHNVINSAPVFCDISTRFEVASYMGVPASILIILHRLNKITALSTPTVTGAERRREMILYLAIGVGLPIIHSTMEVVINAQRFGLYEDYGCREQPWPTWLTWVIYIPWPFIVTLIASVYGGMAYYRLRLRVLESRQFLSNARLTNDRRYQRLLLMTAVVLTLSLSLGALLLWQDAQLPLESEITWNAIHADYNHIVFVPKVFMTSQIVATLEMGRWMPVGSAFIFFAFFGFADEAKTHYRKILEAFKKATGFTFGTAKSAANSREGSYGMNSFTGTLSFVNKNRRANPSSSEVSACSPTIETFSSTEPSFVDDRRRDTVASFIDTLSLAEMGKSLPSTSHETSSLQGSTTLQHIPHSDESASGLSHPPGLTPTEPSFPPTACDVPRRPLHVVIETAPRRFDGPTTARYSTWSEAIRRASVMSMSPQEPLPELNHI